MDNICNWKQQLYYSIVSGSQLTKYLEVDEATLSEIDQVAGIYKMGVSPYLASMLSNRVIRRQFVPDIDELQQNEFLCNDPLSETIHSPVSRMVHKYPDRAAVFASDLCFAYCRHCTRKNTIISGNSIITESEIAAIVEYLNKTPAINDVLITGGDPLTLSDKALESLIVQIRSVPHISTLRIGTRAVVTAPMRITEDLADMLSKYHPVWIHVQFNHPSEITDLSRQSCNILLSRGIPINNQSVLLKGVNDDIDTIKELLLSLIKIRVRPYYIYQCDRVRGTGHLMTDVKTGMQILRDLQGTVPGYAIPRFIIDGEYGKIIAEYSNILSMDDEKLILRSIKGTPHEFKLLS